MHAARLSPPRLALMKFVVGDLDRMTQFYCDVLGLTCSQIIETDAIIEKILTGADDSFALVIYFNKDRRAIAVGNGYGALGCFVADVDAMVENATNAGATLYMQPFDVGGLRVAFVRDPEGREIEFISGHPGWKSSD